MSIETDAQSDLALNPEDAENVVGGKKKTTKKKTVHHAATRSIVFDATPPGSGPATGVGDSRSNDMNAMGTEADEDPNRG